MAFSIVTSISCDGVEFKTLLNLNSFQSIVEEINGSKFSGINFIDGSMKIKESIQEIIDGAFEIKVDK